MAFLELPNFPALPAPLSNLPLHNILLSLLCIYLIHKCLTFLRTDCDLHTYHLRTPPRYFTGKVAWITGASSGIGLALAKRLAKEGALLILTSRRQKALEQAAASLPCPPYNVHILPLDLMADYHVIETAAAEVPEIFGRLDFVFNNAGRSTRVSANDLHVAQVADLIKLDFLSHVALTRACLPALREAPGGSGTIVNTLSIAAMVLTPLRSSYCAAKSAMAAYFGALALEEPRVSVVNVYPGSVRTDISYHAMVQDGKSFGKMDQNIEMGLEPDRVADRMLAAVANKASRAWIARPKELMAVRVSQAFPSVWAFLAKRMAAGYRAKIEDTA